MSCTPLYGDRVSVSMPHASLRIAARRELSDEYQRVLLTILLLVVHVPLAMLVRASSGVATAHAMLVFAIGLFAAICGRLKSVAYISAYIVGAEVLWRLTGAAVPWEFGKYAISLIFILAMLRAKNINFVLLAVIYFALLLPSVMLNFSNEPLGAMRDQLSESLSGPFTLLICICYFAQISLKVDEIVYLFAALISPLCTLAAITGLATFGGTLVRFSDGSNFVTSGGFGPNQVSAALGLGALLCLLIVFDSRSLYLRLLMFLGIILFAVQSVMTFSRGGIYMAVCSAVAALVFLYQDRRWRLTLTILAAMLGGILALVIVPGLNLFTHGELTKRFADTNSTGRTQIVNADLEIWKAHPLLGVGPGRAVSYRASYFRALAAHTEYTRLLAEHGIFGLTAMLMFGLLAWRAIKRRQCSICQANLMALLAWSMLFMLVYDMRIAAPAYVFGLAFVSVTNEATPKLP